MVNCIVGYQEVKDMVLVCHGKEEFNPDLFQSIQNNYYGWNKPMGGLWTSPKDSAHSWENWCRRNNFRQGELTLKFELQFVEPVKVMKIDSMEDFYEIPVVISEPIESLDFEELAEHGVDAIWLTEDGERRTRFGGVFDKKSRVSLSSNLYGWDCETVLLINCNCVVPLPTNP